jgi:hypothetical protein
MSYLQIYFNNYNSELINITNISEIYCNIFYNEKKNIFIIGFLINNNIYSYYFANNLLNNLELIIMNIILEYININNINNINIFINYKNVINFEKYLNHKNIKKYLKKNNIKNICIINNNLEKDSVNYINNKFNIINKQITQI